MKVVLSANILCQSRSAQQSVLDTWIEDVGEYRLYTPSTRLQQAINKTRRRSAQRAAGSPQVSNGSSRGKNMRRERKKDRKRHNFHRRLPHHQLMVVTYKNLQPGIHNQLRVAGVNGVGQVGVNGCVALHYTILSYGMQWVAEWSNVIAGEQS